MLNSKVAHLSKLSKNLDFGVNHKQNGGNDMKKFRAFIFMAVFWLIVLVIQPVAFAQPPKGTREPGEITSRVLEGNLIADRATRRYFVYLPPSYKTGEKPYPSIYLYFRRILGIFLTNVKGRNPREFWGGVRGEFLSCLFSASSPAMRN